MMDRPNADFERSTGHQGAPHPKVIPVEIPIGSGEDFRGIINLFSEKAHIYKPGTQTGEYEEQEIPEEYREMEQRYYQELIETIAATDDNLLEHYLEGDTITREEAIHALKQAMLRGELVPLFCGAPTLTYGVRALLTKLVELMPSPQERPAELARGAAGRCRAAEPEHDPFCALVFKTTSEPHVGELSYFRVFGGSVSSGQEVQNATRGRRRSSRTSRSPQGKERREVEQLRAGDIGVVAKLKDTHTNDTLSAPGTRWCCRASSSRSRTSRSRWRWRRAARRTSSRTRCTCCTRRTPASCRVRPELGQTIARGCGELHLEVQLERMKRKYNVSVVMKEPRIPYRETIRAHRRGARAAQEADGRPRPVRRLPRPAPAARSAARATSSPTRSSAA
jgi:elongation factor G